MASPNLGPLPGVEDYDKGQVPDDIVLPEAGNNANVEAVKPTDVNAFDESGNETKENGESGGTGGSGTAPPPVVCISLGAPAQASACDRWSPLGPLKKPTLLGDSAGVEAQGFGDTIPRDSFGRNVLCKVGQWPIMMLRTVLLAVVPLIFMCVFASLPCYADKDQTILSAGIFGFLTVASALLTTMSPLLMSQHQTKLGVVTWVACLGWMFCLLSAALQVKLAQMGKTGKGIISQGVMLPPAVMIVFATAKSHAQPGWKPKWNTCCCVCGGLNKQTWSAACAGAMAFASGLMLIRFLREDTLVLAESTSPSMIVVRPTMFFVVKKIVYHAFACFSRLRHPVVTKATNIGASTMLGIATAILFSNTRSWADLIFFIVGNWFTFLSKVWTLTGSKGSTKNIVLEGYSWFMSTGKPHVAPGMNKQLLRGFEIQAQNFGTTFGLVVIVAFYPIAQVFFGDQSMIYKLLYQTDMSITFLLVALANEIIEDNMGQLVIGRLTNNDFHQLYSFVPSTEVILGLLMNSVMASVLCSSGWMYRAMKLGPFKED